MTNTEASPTPNWPLKKRHVAAFVIIIAVFIMGVTIRFVRGYTLEGEWAVFDSQKRLTGHNNPDGIRLEYPANWEVSPYSEGGTKNLGDLRVSFYNPFYLFTAKQYLSIWWQRTEDDWTRYDVRDWFIEDIGFEYKVDTLREFRELFQETKIGMGNYPALTQTFQKRNETEERIIVFSVNDEAFVLRVNYLTGDSETEEILKRMINSIEVYD
jgi:hypothetical protein